MLAIAKRLSELPKKGVAPLLQSAKVRISSFQEATLNERCILIDDNDRPVGEASKRHCHEVGKNGNLPLHRAFSVFIFNKNGDLMLQKRSMTKITFPGRFTNTCCSHPLAGVKGESEEHNALGVRRAAQRRLQIELGISPSEINLEDFHYVSRFYYQAAEGAWGEHEVSYALFLRRDNVSIKPNPEEISEITWVPRAGVDDFIKNLKVPLTPWFQLIYKKKLLHQWWDNLNDLRKIEDHVNIHRLT